MTRLPKATTAKVLELLQSNSPKYTLQQIAQECGVSISSVIRIKNRDRDRDRDADSNRPTMPALPALPIGVKNLKQAIRLVNVCEFLGFNKPEAEIYCQKENVDIRELKAFKEAYDRQDIGFLSAMRQQVKAAKQEANAAKEQHRKSETRVTNVEKSLARANATISVLAQSIVSGKSQALLGIDLR